MFKKWFIIIGVGLVLIACVCSIGLSYAFNHSDDDPASAENQAEAIAVSVAAATPVPFAEIIPAVTLRGCPVEPEAFLGDAPDNVTIAFQETVDFEIPGVYEVPITLTYNEDTAKTSAMLYILEPARVVEWESGSSWNKADLKDFIENVDILDTSIPCDVQLTTNQSEIDLNKVRRYQVDLAFNGIPFVSTLNLVDTTPPQAHPMFLTANTGQDIAPEDFLTDIVEISPYTVRYLEDEAPDVFEAGERDVTVIIEDEYGNQTEYTAVLEVLPNTSPPVFTGLQDIEVLLGDAVLFRKNVTACDSFGNSINYTVDSGELDTYLPGEYEVFYTATDVNGNKTTESITVIVLEISEETINALISNVLDGIITDDMTPYDKAKKVYQWITGNVAYVSDSPKDSVYEGAYRAFQYRQGDCFTFYAASEVLLNYLGIDNMRVTRINGNTNHYWNLVMVDDTGWYHFDATPTRIHGLDRFLFTESQAEAYTDRIKKETGAINYYTYDKTLYPEVVP